MILSVDVTGSRVHGLVGTSYTLTCTVILSTRIYKILYTSNVMDLVYHLMNILTDQMIQLLSMM